MSAIGACNSVRQPGLGVRVNGWRALRWRRVVDAALSPGLVSRCAGHDRGSSRVRRALDAQGMKRPNEAALALHGASRNRAMVMPYAATPEQREKGTSSGSWLAAKQFLTDALVPRPRSSLSLATAQSARTRSRARTRRTRAASPGTASTWHQLGARLLVGSRQAVQQPGQVHGGVGVHHTPV